MIGNNTDVATKVDVRTCQYALSYSCVFNVILCECVYVMCGAVCMLPELVRSLLSLYENPPTAAVPSDIANVMLNI